MCIFFFFLLLLGSRAPTTAANGFVRNSLFNLISKISHKERRNSTQAEFTIQSNPEEEETGDSSDSKTWGKQLFQLLTHFKTI